MTSQLLYIYDVNCIEAWQTVYAMLHQFSMALETFSFKTNFRFSKKILRSFNSVYPMFSIVGQSHVGKSNLALYYKCKPALRMHVSFRFNNLSRRAEDVGLVKFPILGKALLCLL